MINNKQSTILAMLFSILKILQSLINVLKAQRPQKGFNKFAEALAKRESGNNYKIVNTLGYLGAYQFGMARLCDLGYTERKPGMSGFSNMAFQWKAGYSKEYFLNNPDFQDKVFKQHCDNLILRINSQFSEYINQTRNGLKITLSGLVAGAHLGGVGGVKNFLTNYYDNSDAFGTKVSDYIREYGDYNLL